MDTRKLISMTLGAAESAVSNLVMAAEKAANNAGKTSIFGKDKGASAHAEFLAKLSLAHHALFSNAPPSVRAASPAIKLGFVNDALVHFRLGYPNWPSAYAYWDSYYILAKEELTTSR